MKALFTLLLALALSTAARASDYVCLAKTAATPLASGSARVVVAKPGIGESSAWWCLDATTATTPANKVTYTPQYFTVLDKYKAHPDLAGAFGRVWAAAAPLDAFNTEVRVGSIAVATGSKDEYEFRSLRYSACLALATPPYLVPIDPLPANWCGAAPLPPGPAADVWRTPASGTFALYTVLAGKLAAKIVGRTATANALGDCSRTKVMSGSSTYCALAAGPLDEATLMRKVPP